MLNHGVEHPPYSGQYQSSPALGEHQQLVPAGRELPQLVPAGREHQQLVPAGREHQLLVPAGRELTQLLPTGREHLQLVPVDRENPQPVPAGREHPQLVPAGREHPQPVPAGREHQQLVPAGGEHPQPVPAGREHLQLVPAGRKHQQLVTAGSRELLQLVKLADVEVSKTQRLTPDEVQQHCIPLPQTLSSSSSDHVNDRMAPPIASTTLRNNIEIFGKESKQHMQKVASGEPSLQQTRCDSNVSSVGVSKSFASYSITTKSIASDLVGSVLTASGDGDEFQASLQLHKNEFQEQPSLETTTPQQPSGPITDTTTQQQLLSMQPEPVDTSSELVPNESSKLVNDKPISVTSRKKYKHDKVSGIYVFILLYLTQLIKYTCFQILVKIFIHISYYSYYF